jgi:hypothetical protein
MTTNFITPPDFVDEPNHSVLLIDVDPVDVETLAFLCAGHDEAFNVYLYRTEFDDIAWLTKAASQVDAIIINTEDSTLSSTKDLLIGLPKTYYYGPKTFLNEDRKYTNVLDYFIQRSHERKHPTNSL